MSEHQSSDPFPSTEAVKAAEAGRAQAQQFDTALKDALALIDSSPMTALSLDSCTYANQAIRLYRAVILGVLQRNYTADNADRAADSVLFYSEQMAGKLKTVPTLLLHLMNRKVIPYLTALRQFETAEERAWADAEIAKMEAAMKPLQSGGTDASPSPTMQLRRHGEELLETDKAKAKDDVRELLDHTGNVLRGSSGETPGESDRVEGRQEEPRSPEAQ